MKRFPDEIVNAVKACRGHLWASVAFSLAINLLYLAGPLYMMQVYDRVMASGSGMTLAMLTLVTLLSYATLAGLDHARSCVLAAASLRLDRLLAARAFAAMMGSAVGGGSRNQQALRDLDACRQFVGGSGMTALLDLPWLPVNILIAFLLHWAVGLFALACALLLVLLAVLSEVRLRALSSAAQSDMQASYAWAEASLRNANAVQAMGMMPALSRRWLAGRGRAAARQHAVAERSMLLAAIVRGLRLSMQSLVLGLGAWLVLERSMAGGAIFAASLILGRALQPVEQVIGQWQPMLAARAALDRLGTLLDAQAPLSLRRQALPESWQPRLVAEDVSFEVEGREVPIIEGVSFAVEPGEGIGLIGPSGAGKSTLVRLLAGAVAPTRGSITLGGIEMTALSTATGTPLVGYLPQECELFDDTIAANIGRFRPECEEEIVRAAQLAGAHELVLGLPDGYATRVGVGGSALSGGMRQRIALARAVLGQPRLLVLDEPSANLDQVGDRMLARCIRSLQARGTTVIMISHRRDTTALMGKFLVLIDGRVTAFGTRAEVVRRLSVPTHRVERGASCHERSAAAS